jgi:O-antigen/teichoic acid export membrane protein
VQTALFLLLTPWIIHQLGAESFAIWSLLLATAGLLSLVDLGFSSAVMKFVAEARGSGRADDARETTATMFWAFNGLAVVLLVLAALLIEPLPRWLDLPPEQWGSIRTVFLLLALRSAQALPLGIFVGILSAHRRADLSNAIRTAGVSIYAIAVAAALWISPSLEVLGWAGFLTSVGTNLGLWAAARTVPDWSLSLRLFRWDRLWRIVTYTSSLFLTQAATLLATRVDTIILAAFAPLQTVALYSVALRVADQAGIFSRQPGAALTPLLSEWKGAGNTERLREALQRGTFLVAAGVFPFLFLGAWFAPDLLVLWVGEEFRAAGLPCRLLLIAAGLGALHQTAENYLLVAGRHRFASVIIFSGQLFNVGLSLLLVRDFGMTGVAGATLLTACVVGPILLWRAASDLQLTSFLLIYLGGLMSLAAPLMALLGIVGLTNLIGHPVIAMAVAGLIGLPAYGLLVWRGLSPSERDYYVRRFRRRASGH